MKTYTKANTMKTEDFEKFKIIDLQVFNGAAARGSLNNKDYPSAQKYFQAALDTELRIDPNDAGQLQNVYPLAVAYLAPKTINVVGLWYTARAVVLRQGAAQTEIGKYGKAKYYYYHGGDDGWDQLVAQAATQTTPPPNFSVAPAKTPAEQIQDLVKRTDPKQMDFDQWKLVFTYGDQPTNDNVWNAIKGVPLAFRAKVIQAENTKLLLAATYDGTQDNKADTEVLMDGPIPATKMPKVGADIDIVAAPVLHDTTPTHIIHFHDGKFAAAKGAAHTPPAPEPRHHTPK